MTPTPPLMLDELIADARVLLTLFGPKVSAAQDENPGLRHCTICTPPPKVYTCFICRFETEDRWRYNLHVDLNPKWCQEAGERWANNYARIHAE